MTLNIPRKVCIFHKASPFHVYPKILFYCAEFVQKHGMVVEGVLSPITIPLPKSDMVIIILNLNFSVGFGEGRGGVRYNYTHAN